MNDYLMDEEIYSIIYKVSCQHYHCSDSDNKQYPDCKERGNYLVCPALKIIDLYEEIEKEKTKREFKSAESSQE